MLNSRGIRSSLCSVSFSIISVPMSCLPSKCNFLLLEEVFEIVWVDSGIATNVQMIVFQL